jgi:hypothetical protein
MVLDHFIDISTLRVMDGIIHYGGHTHVVPESTPLAGNYGYSYEYEAS